MSETTGQVATEFDGHRLLTAVGQSISTKRATDQARYVAIIQNPLPEHADEMEAIASRLGKTTGDIQADLSAVRRAGELEDIIRKSKGARSAVTAVRQKLTDHVKETDRLAVEREQQRIVLDRLEMESVSAMRTAGDYVDKLAELKMRFPAVLSGRPPVELED